MPRVIKNGFSVPKASSVLIPDMQPPPEEPVAQPDGDKQEELLSVEEVEAQCETRLEQARLQSEELLQRAREETAQIRERAAREGYAAGAAQKGGEIAACIREVREQMDRMEADLDEFIENYRMGLTDLSVEIARRVIGDRISKDELVLSEMVGGAVNSIKKADWIRVEVSDRLPALLEHLRSELGGAGNVEVAGKELPQDACLIQMPEGILDASVGSQLENIRQALGKNGEFHGNP